MGHKQWFLLYQSVIKKSAPTVLAGTLFGVYHLLRWVVVRYKLLLRLTLLILEYPVEPMRLPPDVLCKPFGLAGSITL